MQSTQRSEYTGSTYQVLKRVIRMRVAICDDEKIFRDELKSAVFAYSDKHRLEIVADEFTSGEHLLKSNEKYDIIFLDYKMNGIDGLDTARALRDRNVACTIIFLTSYPSFVYESFEVGTFRFFKKPLEPEKLHRAFDDYFKRFGTSYPIPLTIDRETRCVETKDIIYLEADNKCCFIHLATETLHCAKTMAVIGRMLPKNHFYQIHKAFIVNLNYIDRYDNEYIYFKNKARVHISRKYWTSFKAAYMHYSRSRMI